ncbi:MAG: hypothetical protein ACTSYI_12675 [Promethearchaeota archaeon]
MQDSLLFIIVLVVMFGGPILGFYLFLFSVLSMDINTGIHIFTKFSTKKMEWHQIEEISLILNLQEQSTLINRGMMLIFLKPYLYHTRLVVLRVKTTNNKLYTCRLQINLNKINTLIRMLSEVDGFGVSRSKVHKSKMVTHLKEPKVRENKPKDVINKETRQWRDQWRGQWLSQPVELKRHQQRYGLLIKDQEGKPWNKEYSHTAHMMQILGFLEVCWLILSLVLYVCYLASIVGRTMLSISLGILGGILVIGFFFMFLTPEMAENSKVH